WSSPLSFSSCACACAASPSTLASSDVVACSCEESELASSRAWGSFASNWSALVAPAVPTATFSSASRAQSDAATPIRRRSFLSSSGRTQAAEASEPASKLLQVADKPQESLRFGSAFGDFPAGQVGDDDCGEDADPEGDPRLAPVAPPRVAEGELDRGLADPVVHQPSPPSPWLRRRCAIRDCNDQSSMKPGEAFWSNN